MIKLTVDRSDVNKMVERGIKLHGHAGPYLNLGIRMGLMALEMLDLNGYFDLFTDVELKYKTPVSCLVDGLQISTGCTMGKRNIRVINNPDAIRASFKVKNDNKVLIVSLKPEITDLINFKENSCENLGENILKMSDPELFDYEVKNESI